MADNHLSDTNVESYQFLPSPEELKRELPLTKKGWDTVTTARKSIEAILDGKDTRKIFIVGPCSIHDLEQAREYVEKLTGLAQKIEDKFLVVMRTYFEKPRTSLGWKGFISDPFLDGSSNIAEGRRQARELLLYIAEKGLPAATETLSTSHIQCYDHLIAYACIGARTTEAQTHRELASGLAMPVGFKNATSGDVTVAIDAVIFARSKHQFDGMTLQGREAIVHTRGNEYAHIVLRGGKDEANYLPAKVQEAQDLLAERELPRRLIIDCSHGNSGRNHKFQPVVFQNVLEQIKTGNKDIVGVMIESNLCSGRQSIPQDLQGFDKMSLQYGVSITDACLGWKETEEMILNAYAKRT